MSEPQPRRAEVLDRHASGRTLQARRRDAQRARQRERRRDLTEHARRLAAAEASEEEPAAAAVPAAAGAAAAAAATADDKRRQRAARGRERRAYFAAQLATPEWMLEPPEDLAAGWFVLPRPEGTRCLVVAAHGRTTVRSQAGQVLARLQTPLPCGSQATAGAGGVCVLDGVWAADVRVVWAMDVMVWRGTLLYNESAETRLFLLHSRLEEFDAPQQQVLAVPFAEASPEGVARARERAFAFAKDGLVLMDRAASYELGITALTLVWKDAETSRYLFPSTAEHVVVLAIGEDAVLRTHDGHALGSASPEDVARHALAPGDLLRFAVAGVAQDDPPRVAAMQFSGKCTLKRAVPDCWSKIVFQARMRAGAGL